MNLFLGWRLVRSTILIVGLGLDSPRPARAEPAAPEVKPLRVKNARTINVVLGKRRERAAGVRPERDGGKDGGKESGKESGKNGWVVVVGADMARSSATLQDITPGVPGSRWVLPLEADRLVLDSERFLPSHVYRLELRREGQPLGSALIYLYPPPAERVGRADFSNDSDHGDGDDKPASLTTIPKGELSR